MERKYYFEIGNWEEAAWQAAKHDPARFQDEIAARNLLKNSVVDELSRKSLAELKGFEPIVYGPIMALASAFLQHGKEGEYESVHVHFWHCLATMNHATVEVHRHDLDVAAGPSARLQEGSAATTAAGTVHAG
ncbi:hypothetical protein [Undibacterium sp.]|uniref:hypothetical protein n=1 Tax=Undibacterium sp. TaxID=1914977 RepID=UPI002C6273F2|nr:hypothetical protein [Undibacterium sp.]HTD03331.1 hypothetical protein [Undibacterium sp.]